MKQKILLLTLLLCSAFISNKTKAETEPNDTQAKANTLQLNSNSSGTIGSVGDNDWYKITTIADGRLRLTLTPQSSVDVYAVLYDHDGTTQLGGAIEAYNNNAAVLNVDGLAPGSYYVKIYPYSNSTGAYKIADSSFKPAQKNDTEPNNYALNALKFAPDSSTGGHLDYYYNHVNDNADWYKLTTPASGTLSITLSALNGADFYATLYSADTTTQLGQIESYSNNPATLNANGVAAGKYYIKIHPYSNSFGTYTLKDTLIRPDQKTDKEPNNYAKNADTLPLNAQLGGKLGYTTNGKVDGSDWYLVTTKSDGLLRITLSSQNGADFYARLYDKDTTTQLGQIESYNNTPAVLNANGLAAGTYYIKLFPYSTSFGTYTLADSSFAPTYVNDAEPNNYAKKAITLALNNHKTGHLDYYYNGTRDNSDWYKITTTSDGALRLILATAENADFYMRLYDKDSTTQIATAESYSGTGNTATLTADGLAKGTYYVQLYPYSTTYGSYKLTDSLLKYTTADAEPNDHPYQAATIASNSTVTGDIDFHYNKNNDVADWWKLKYTGANNGTIKITYDLVKHISDGNYGDVYFYVYKDTSGSPVSTAELYGATGSGTVTLTLVQQGNYYIKVFPYSTSFSGYKISPVFNPAGFAEGSNINSYDNFSINNKLIGGLLSVSPNPATSFFVIHYNSKTQEKVNGILYNANGRTIWASGLINANALNDKQVNVNQFTKGVYYLKIINEKGELIGNTKIIIAK